MTITTKNITPQVITQSLDYATYRTMIDKLFEENKTTGDDHSEAMLHYTKMNIQRMRRLDKKTTLLEEAQAIIKNINQPMIWLTVTEGWCGDAAYIVPVIDQLAALNDNISHRLILRDEHLDIMDEFLTNSARAIPITIILNANTLEVLGHWGPRPRVGQQMIIDGKQNPDTDWKALKVELQRWYAKDKTISTQL